MKLEFTKHEIDDGDGDDLETRGVDGMIHLNSSTTSTRLSRTLRTWIFR